MKNLLKTFFILLIFTTTTFPTDIDFTKIEDWTPADSTSKYDSSNLWEYINGAADLFIAYGFQNLQSCEISSGDIECAVDVYNMGTRLNAFGMYKTEIGEVKEKFNIGVEAVITSPNQCLMLKDIYYVKVNVYEGQLSEQKGKKLLKSIAEILPGSNEFPDEFKLLPSENKIENTENFAKEGYLGLSELNNCLYASYHTIQEHKFQYFVVIPEAKETSDKIWGRLSSNWKFLENKKYPLLFRKIPYKGLVGVIKTEEGIIGVTDSANEVESIERLERAVEE